MRRSYTVNPDCNVSLRKFPSGECEWQVTKAHRFSLATCHSHSPLDPPLDCGPGVLLRLRLCLRSHQPVAFFVQFLAGSQGMPRRYIDYPEAFAYWNWWSSLGAFLAFGYFLFFFGVMAYSLRKGAPAKENNPWTEYADTLEWTLPSPPPEHTFEILPKREDTPQESGQVAEEA